MLDINLIVFEMEDMCWAVKRMLRFRSKAREKRALLFACGRWEVREINVIFGKVGGSMNRIIRSGKLLTFG
jgi:hypothetical protein